MGGWDIRAFPDTDTLLDYMGDDPDAEALMKEVAGKLSAEVKKSLEERQLNALGIHLNGDDVAGVTKSTATSVFDRILARDEKARAENEHYADNEEFGAF